MKDEKRPFLSHLTELRNRLLIAVVAFGIALIFTYNYKEEIFSVLMQPFVAVMPKGSSFIFTSITEAFMAYFKLSLVSAGFLASPVILFELWMFVAPGLYEKEKRYIFPFIIFGSALFVAGALFCYFLVMPFLFRFFVGFGSDFIVPMPSLKEYMGLAIKLLVMFGLMFEMPLLVYYLAKIGVIKYSTLARKRRYAILAIFVVSAVITPPDVASQMLMVVPMYGLYEISIVIARVVGKRKERKEKKHVSD
jgi:sec-independent protein translocase protein TatC